MTKHKAEKNAEMVEKYGNWKPYQVLMLLIGLTPDTPERWKESLDVKISIVIVSLAVSSMTILFPSFIILKLVEGRICVPGNKNYETNTGICASNGKKEKMADALAEKNAKAAEALEKKKRDAEATIRAIRFICEENIKTRLREPSSYERISSTFYGSQNKSSKKGVIIEYRARNGFGGMNVISGGCVTETGRVEDLKLSGNTEQ
jgi:hypothetical protein